jgi:hypothetical protein
MLPVEGDPGWKERPNGHDPLALSPVGEISSGRLTEQLPLSESEQKRLAELETAFAKVCKVWIDGALILLEIRDSKLYREQYGTFEKYCRERWQMSRRHANRLISASTVLENLGPIWSQSLKTCHQVSDEPLSESQLRPLTKLTPEQQKEAFQKAKETAPDGKLTAEHIANTAKALVAESNPTAKEVEDSVRSLLQEPEPGADEEPEQPAKDAPVEPTEYEQAIREVQERFYQKRVEEARKIYGPECNVAGVCRHITNDKLVATFFGFVSTNYPRTDLGFEEQEKFAETLDLETRLNDVGLTRSHIVARFHYLHVELENKRNPHPETEYERAQREWDQQQRLFCEDIQGLRTHSCGLLRIIEGNPTTTFDLHPELRRAVHLAWQYLAIRPSCVSGSKSTNPI